MAAKPYKLGQNLPKVNILLYGYPGAGKTKLAATAQYSEHMRDVLIVNVEGGLITVAGQPDNLPRAREVQPR